MPRTLALGSGSERPTGCQPEPRSSLTTIRPPAAAQMRCGRVASAAIMSTGAAAPPKPASCQLCPPSWLIIARPSITAATMPSDPGIAASAVISTNPSALQGDSETKLSLGAIAGTRRR